MVHFILRLHETLKNKDNGSITVHNAFHYKNTWHQVKRIHGSEVASNLVRSSSFLLKYCSSSLWSWWNALSQLSKNCDINTWLEPLPITFPSESVAFKAAEQLVAAQGPTGAGGRTRSTAVGLVNETAEWPGWFWPAWAELGLEPGGD